MTTLQLKTEPDFFTKAKDKVLMPEELRHDLTNKYHYIKDYLESLTLFLAANKVRTPYEKSEHGRRSWGNKVEMRRLSATKCAGLINEITLMTKEKNRLQDLITA